jgi:hypothetical protein
LPKLALICRYLTYSADLIIRVLWVTEKSHLNNFGIFLLSNIFLSAFHVLFCTTSDICIKPRQTINPIMHSYIFFINTLQLIFMFWLKHFSWSRRKSHPRAREDFQSGKVIFFSLFSFHGIRNTPKFRNKFFHQHRNISLLEPFKSSVNK